MSDPSKEQRMGLGIIATGLVAWAVVWWTKKPDPPPPPAPVPVVIVPAEQKMAGLMDGTIDAARDRAIAKAGTSWPEIQKWVGQFRRVMDALDPANKMKAEEPPVVAPPPSPAVKREIQVPAKQPVKIPNTQAPSNRYRVWRTY